MKESQIHDAFMAWLKKQGLWYVHAAFGKKSTMTKDAPDFIILHCNRALLVECKTEKGALTAGQKALFAKLQTESGMVVQIARSVEMAVSAVQQWLGVETDAGEAVRPGVGPSKPVRQVNEPAGLWIAGICGADYVFSGDPSPGGLATKVHRATAADLINLPRK